MPPKLPNNSDVAAAYRTLIAHETSPKEQDFFRARLHRLEQATEPTEERCAPASAQVSGNIVAERNSSPAPAVPAEEETKAERVCEVNGRTCFGCNACTLTEEEATLAARAEGWYEGYEVGLEYGPIAASGEEYDGPINPYDVPASSPVVPAPTETGPWETWEAVPVGMTVKAVNGERFRKNVGGAAVHLYSDGVGDCCKVGFVADSLAPFVAAEEGDA